MSIACRCYDNFVILPSRKYFDMLPQSIINMILAKYGKDKVYSADCTPMAAEIGISVTTVKRMLGLVGEDSPERNRIPHTSTMDILARWLGYENYKALLREIGEHDYSSEFISMESIDVSELEEGTQLQIKYEPGRIIVMTYLGNRIFLINESKNSKLLKGDRIKVTNLVLGHELLVMDTIRDGKHLGGFTGAKDGGLTSLEIIV